MDRREFLKGGLLAGGLIPVAALGGTAPAPAAVFERRGTFERLSLAYRHVRIGLAEPFSLLHISDTHLSEAYPDEGEQTVRWAAIRNQVFGGRQRDALASSLAWAKGNVDYVLHTGDLVDFQTRANFDCVRRLYGAAAPLGTTGNHEYQREPYARNIRNTAAYNAESRGALDAAFGFDTSFAAGVVRGVNFVRLDNSYGTVTADQAARFEAEVKKGLPIVLCMHAPFYAPLAATAADKYWCRGHREDRKLFRAGEPPARWGDFQREEEDAVTREFVRSLKAQPLLKAILAGHLHLDAEDCFSPTAMQYVVGGNFLYHGAEILFT